MPEQSSSPAKNQDRPTLIKKHLPVPIDQKPLTPRQKKIVDHILATGDSNSQTAKTLKLHRTTVQRIMHLPHIERYMTEAVGQNLRRSAVGAALTLQRLSTSARSEYVQLHASDSILDRSGYKPPDRQEGQVEGDLRITIDLS